MAEISKVVAYAVTDNARAEIAKLVAYAVTNSVVETQVSKIVAYAVTDEGAPVNAGSSSMFLMF